MRTEIEEIIKSTVDSTVQELKRSRMPKVRSTFQKTEDLLRNYNALSVSLDPAGEIITRIETALSYIKDDPYYGIVLLYYIEGKTLEQLSEQFNVSVPTISRNKTRLVRQLAVLIFPTEYINELYAKTT